MALHEIATDTATNDSAIESPTPTKEGKIPYDIASIDHPCFTYYKVFGDLNSEATPLLAVHGGPGAGHGSLCETYSQLWPLYRIPVIFYDQIGCGGSTHLPQTNGDHSFWTLELFLNELNNVVDFFKLRGTGFHLLGHSWGGMLAASFAGTQPRGLQRLVLASANASKILSASGVLTSRLDLPPDVQRTLKEKEEKREFGDPEYKTAMDVFLKKHLYRGDPPPPEVMASMKTLREDPTVHSTTQGPAITLNEGSLREWTSIPTLHKITAPTLVFNGDTDTSHDISQEPFFELIPRVRWITLPNASHMAHSQPELRPRILKLVGEFLTPANMEERARVRGWYSDTPRTMPDARR